MASKKLTLTQEELQKMIADAVAQAIAAQPTTAGKTGKGKPASELVEFKKADGTTVMATPKQATAWEKWRSGSSERKEQFEQVKKEWQSKREGYKPSKALEDAIKADRCAVTHKVAKETYGFVGTKDDLKQLKARICK